MVIKNQNLKIHLAEFPLESIQKECRANSVFATMPSPQRTSRNFSFRSAKSQNPKTLIYTNRYRQL